MSADSMNSVFGFIGILAVGCGIYCLYAYFNMKKDGHINETILLGKSYSEKMCKDKEAYLKKALPAVLGFGIVSILYGMSGVDLSLEPVFGENVKEGSIFLKGNICIFSVLVIALRVYRNEQFKKFISR